MAYLEALMRVNLAALSDRTTRTFGSLCSDKPTVFYFIRRFGCSLCRWGAKDISQIIPVVGDRYAFNLFEETTSIFDSERTWWRLRLSFSAMKSSRRAAIGQKRFMWMRRKNATPPSDSPAITTWQEMIIKYLNYTLVCPVWRVGGRA